MRFFPLLDFQHWVYGTALGIILVIAVYITWRGYPHDRESADDPFQELQPDFVPQSEHHPVTPVLVFLYVAVGIWIVSYWLVVGVLGRAII
ncbi:MAG: hypothetical protein C4519_00630 [Desulfobacteraceae bacterium]|nr:MAG: hypothetical protein C4519_00630 [Desulfobacteraceae bacterium]